MGRLTVVTATVGAAMFLANIVMAADYPVVKRQAPDAVRGEQWPHCYVGRYAYVRYAPVLATASSVRPIFVSMPVPCTDRG